MKAFSGYKHQTLTAIRSKMRRGSAADILKLHGFGVARSKWTRTVSETEWRILQAEHDAVQTKLRPIAHRTVLLAARGEPQQSWIKLWI